MFSLSLTRMILKLAAASLYRRANRTFIVILMIAVSIWGLIFMQGIYEGMTEQMISNSIRSGSGDLSINAQGYRLEQDLHKFISGSDQLASKLEADPRIKSFVKRISQDGLAATARYSRSARLYGINLEDEQAHGKLAGYLKSGTYDFAKKGHGALLGVRLAEKLKVKIGSKIIFSAQSLDNEIAATALKVRGIIKTNNMALDQQAIFIDQQECRDFLGLPIGFSQFSVILKNQQEAPALQDDLQPLFPNLEIWRWDQLSPALYQGRVMMEKFNYVTWFLVFCIAALGIFGVLLVSVLERIREFGMMLAIGSEFSMIRTIVLWESFFIGFCGYLVGSALALSSLYYFKIYGLDLTHFSKGLDAFGMDAVMYAIIKPSYFITGLIAVMGATGLSVILPLRILKQAKPIEAINK